MNKYLRQLLYLLVLVTLLIGCARADRSAYPVAGFNPADISLPPLPTEIEVTLPTPTASATIEVVIDQPTLLPATNTPSLAEVSLNTPTVAVPTPVQDVQESQRCTSQPGSGWGELMVEYQIGEYTVFLDSCLPQINRESWEILLAKMKFSPLVIKVMVKDYPWTAKNMVISSMTGVTGSYLKIYTGDGAEYFGFVLAPELLDWPTALDYCLAEYMFLSSEYVKEGYTPSDHGEFADTAFFISEHPLFTGIDYGKEGKQYRFRFGRRYAFKVPTTKNWAFLRPVVMEGEYGRYQEQEEGMLIVADSVLTGVLIPGVNWGSNNESFDPFLFFQLGKEQTSSTSAGWYVFVPVDELELLKIDIID